MNMSGLNCLGYQRITPAATATGLTIPAGTVMAMITPETQDIRWRADGTDPTASVGYPLPVGAELTCDTSNLPRWKCIDQTLGAVVNVMYFGEKTL